MPKVGPVRTHVRASPMGSKTVNRFATPERVRERDPKGIDSASRYSPRRSSSSRPATHDPLRGVKALSTFNSYHEASQNIPRETDPHRLKQRQKQIDFGKNTVGYDRYLRSIPKHKRTKEHPRTPDKSKVMSKRGWDGLVKVWRRQLHAFDGHDDVEEWDKSPGTPGGMDIASSRSGGGGSLDDAGVERSSAVNASASRGSIDETKSGSVGDACTAAADDSLAALDILDSKIRQLEEELQFSDGDEFEDDDLL